MVSEDEIRQRVQACVAHADHADTLDLKQSLFGNGWFDPD
jgi:hypothetical protein